MSYIWDLMEILKHFLEYVKSSTRIILGFTLFCGILLFLPQNTLEYSGLLSIVNFLRPFLALFFILGISLLLINIFTEIRVLLIKLYKTHGSVIFYGRFSNHHQICWSRADEAYIYPIQSKICHIHARYFAHCLLGTDRHTPNIGDLTGMFLYIGKHESFLQ